MKGLWYALAKLICWTVFRIGFGLSIKGREHVPKRGAFIVASNHLSFLDPPLVGAACPRRLCFLARADLFHQPFLGALLRSLGVIPLKRAAHDLAAIRRALAELQRGRPIVVFPEGTRQLSGTIGVSKRGIGLLAGRAQVPIVPVLVQGTFEALPPDAAWPRRAKIQVAFGPPIPYTVPPKAGATRIERQQALAEAVTQAWRALSEALRHPARGAPHARLWQRGRRGGLLRRPRLRVAN